jgi:hypothetical protein
MITDPRFVAQAFVDDSRPWKFRWATVSSVETDRTCTVDFGDGTSISEVQVLGLTPARPTAVVGVLVDGADAVIIGERAIIGNAAYGKAKRLDSDTRLSLGAISGSTPASRTITFKVVEGWILSYEV